jgi:hypothetical protein
VSDNTITSSVDRSIDLPDGSITTGQTSQPQSDEGNKAVRLEAVVPLPRPRPYRAPAARSNERKLVNPPKAFSPFEAFGIVPP